MRVATSCFLGVPGVPGVNAQKLNDLYGTPCLWAGVPRVKLLKTICLVKSCAKGPVYLV